MEIWTHDFLAGACGAVISRSWYFVHEDEEVPKEQAEQYQKLLVKRGERIPLQQLTHEAYFYGMKFYVNEHVLIPRQDTEILIEEVLKEAGGKKGLCILDMCTGSGCILLSLLAECKDRIAMAMGVDISKDALQVAIANGNRMELPAEFRESDLFYACYGYL